MQHIAKVLACMDPDGGSPEEWDEILQTQEVDLIDATARLFDCGMGLPSHMFREPMAPAEALERAVTLGVLPAEFLDGRHVFNTRNQPLCDCYSFTSDDIWRHDLKCRLMRTTNRPTHVESRAPEFEGQTFSFLMRLPEILAAVATASHFDRVVWCSRSTSVAYRKVLTGGLWLQPLGNGAVAIGVPPVRYNSMAEKLKAQVEALRVRTLAEAPAEPVTFA